jgi:hypothetical protein
MARQQRHGLITSTAVYTALAPNRFKDFGGIFADTRRFRATETALSLVAGGKAAESRRLFRRRQESDCAGLRGGAGRTRTCKRL